MSKNGFLFIATREHFIRAANDAARSIREVMPKFEIDIYCDQPEHLEEGLFDRVELIVEPHRRSKVDYLSETRFERTIYLDTDIRVIEDVSDLFDLGERFDLAIAHAHARNQLRTTETWRKELPASFPQFNGGVIFYNSGKPEVIDFMQQWKEAYHTAGFEKDQVTLRELLWDSELRIHALPPEYNIRYERYLKFWKENEAKPKILHFKRFKVSERQVQKKETQNNSFNWRKKLSLLNPVSLIKPKTTNTKVFCVGFHKTGTTSLTKALKILGYNPIHGDGRKTWSGADEGETLTALIDDKNFDLPTLPLFDAFLDNPYFSIWRELDAAHTGKFILTIRDPEKWIQSCCNFYKGRRVRHMRKWMFGEHADPNSSPEARQAWIDKYNHHNAMIKEHFGSRSDFLVLDITKEGDWGKLCEFLNKPIPRSRFPHVNKTKTTKNI